MKIVFMFAVAFLVASSDARVLRKRQAKPCPDDCKHKPLEISFVVDSSASIWSDNFTIGMWFVQDFVDKFEIAQDKTRVSLVTYGDRVYEEDAIDFEDFGDKESLNEAIDSIPYRSGLSTQTGDAISYMLDHQLPHARPKAKKVIIVLTDGNSQRPDVTKAQAERALEENLEVFAIGVGHDVSEEELHNIASDDNHEFVVNTYHMLDDILDRLAFEACGGPPPKEQCQMDPVDMVFVIDSSQSIGEEKFPLGLQFIKEFVEAFDIRPESSRVAAVMFGDRVYEESAFPLSAHANKKETLDAILNLQWMHGTSTETALGIDYMVDHFLPEVRHDAAHVVIVITDGKSQKWKNTKESAARARAEGATMFAVGVGTLGPDGSLDEEELNGIAGDPRRVVTTEDYAMLNTIRQRLTRITCKGIAQSLEARGVN